MTLKRQAFHVALGATILSSALLAGSVQAQPFRDPPPPPVEPAAAPVAPPPAVSAPVAAQPAPAPASSSSRGYLRQQASKKPVASAPTTSPLRIALMGGLVAGLAVWALLKRRRQQTVARATRSDLEIVSTARVGNKAQVVVVNVGGRKVLLGVTDSEVSRLAWLDGELEGDGAATEPFEEPSPFASVPQQKPVVVAPVESKPARIEPRRFRDALLGALGQPQKPAATPASTDAAVAIAESMQDVVTRSPRVALPAEAPASMVDVEGQAKGLVLRLQKRA
ncbi:MAG: flagellar biosynthetic protein FliO [Myxococcota bacterium]